MEPQELIELREIKPEDVKDLLLGVRRSGSSPIAITPALPLEATPSENPAGGTGITVDSFLQALSGQESGGNYNSQNKRTAAYGKYQIMPANWSGWAKEAGLPANAPKTPENQEKITRFKIQQYFNNYGNWGDVASVWYSGKPLTKAIQGGYANRKQGAGNEPSIQEYVNSLMKRLSAT